MGFVVVKGSVVYTIWGIHLIPTSPKKGDVEALLRAAPQHHLFREMWVSFENQHHTIPFTCRFCK